MFTGRLTGVVAIGVALFGCGKDNSESVNGHWHTHPTGFDPFETLDIEDSLAISNKYQIGGHNQAEYPRKNDQGHSILPFDEYTYSETFNRKGDSLEIKDSIWTYTHYRSNLKNCILSDRYVYSSIAVSLPYHDSADNYNTSYKQYCSEDIFVGKLKQGNTYYDSLSNAFPDSIFVQTRDVWVEMKDVSKAVALLKDLCPDRPNSLYIHADKNVPEAFLKRLLTEISKAENIKATFGVVLQGDGDIGLRKLSSQ